MKKTIFRHMMLVAFVGSLLMTGCKKEEPINSSNAGVRKLRFVTEKTVGESKTTVNDLEVKFVNGDKVGVNGNTYFISADGEVDVDVTGNVIAVHPATISSAASRTDNMNFSLPTTYGYNVVNGLQKVDMPMVGVSSTESVPMKHLCSAMKVVINNMESTPLTVENVTLSNSTYALSGSVNVGIASDGTISYTPSTSGTKSVTMQMGNITVEANGSLTVTIPVLPVSSVQEGTTIEVNGLYLEKATPKRVVYTRKSSKQLERANLYTANVNIAASSSGNVTVKDIPSNARPNLFSVSDNKKVYFSKANLRAYNATANSNEGWIWSFHNNQYDFVGNNVANNKVGDNQITEAGYVDLFGWVGEHSSLSSYGINSSTDNTQYGNTTGESLKSDWGKVFGEESPWRTLTNDEWGYLFTTRTGARWARLKVNGTTGMLIFPDNCVTVEENTAEFAGITINHVNQDGSLPWENVQNLSESEWSTLENAGCVFLPAAFYRGGTSVYGVGAYGGYWSSTAFGTEQARYLSFSAGVVNPQNSYGRCRGFSVRLVQDF